MFTLLVFINFLPGFIKAIRLLIEKGYKNQIHSRTAFGESPINRAVAAQEFEITDLLIKMGSNLNDQESYVSYSPLMTAALIGKAYKRGERKARNCCFNNIDLKSNDLFSFR